MELHFNVGALARFLDLDPETVLALVKKGDLSAQRVEGHLIFDKKKINRWLIETGRDEGASQERMKHPSNRLVGYPQRPREAHRGRKEG